MMRRNAIVMTLGRLVPSPWEPLPLVAVRLVCLMRRAKCSNGLLTIVARRAGIVKGGS